MPVPSPIGAAELLDRHHLELRARLLEVAAMLDRVDRAAGDTSDDPRTRQIDRALELLHESDSERTEKLQHLFSRAYAAQWRQEMDL